MTNLQLQARTEDAAGKKESPRQHAAYIDYRDMGPGRSLRKLAERYIAHDAPTVPPTTRLGTLETWSARFGWQARIAEWEKHQQALRDEAYEQARIQERVHRQKLLDRMRNKLEKQMMHANLHEDHQAFTAFVNAWNKYMEQSRREFNDLPTSRTDVTSDGKEVNVAFHIQPPE